MKGRRRITMFPGYNGFVHLTSLLWLRRHWHVNGQVSMQSQRQTQITHLCRVPCVCAGGPWNMNRAVFQATDLWKGIQFPFQRSVAFSSLSVTQLNWCEEGLVRTCWSLGEAAFSFSLLLIWDPCESFLPFDLIGFLKFPPVDSKRDIHAFSSGLLEMFR